MITRSLPRRARLLVLLLAFGTVHGAGPSVPIRPAADAPAPARVGQKVERSGQAADRAPSGAPSTVKLNPAFVAGQDVAFFDISPNGTRVVYAADQDTDGLVELYSVPIGGAASVKLNATMPPGAAGIESEDAVEISPDGQWVYYIADQVTAGVDSLHRVPIDGAAAPIRLDAAGVAGSRGVRAFALSPDGTRVLYRVDAATPGKVELYSVLAAGGAAVKLNHALPGSATDVISAIAGDGISVYVADDDPGVNEGDFASLALDASGNPRISSYVPEGDVPEDDPKSAVLGDPPGGDLKYAAFDGTRWVVETVDSAGIVGPYTSLALDGAGNPRISYRDVTNGNLKYAAFDGTSWAVETVDSAGNVGQYTSLALDGAGKPRISYYDAGNGDLKYAAFDGGSWIVDTVDSAGVVGTDTSLALDASGNPRISYYDLGNGDLKYAAFDGTSWILDRVDSAGTVGQYTSLALDSSGNPRISYFDVTDEELKYAALDGGSWSVETVDNSVSSRIIETSLALDASDHPHIFYDRDRPAGPDELMYATHDGTGWTFETVASTSSASLYRGKYLALDAAGNPRGVFSQGSLASSTMRYAARNGASWSVERLDSSDEGEAFNVYSVPTDGSGPAVKRSGSVVQFPAYGRGVKQLAFDDALAAPLVYRSEQDTLTFDELYSVSASAEPAETPLKLNAPLVSGGDVIDFDVSPGGDAAVYRADQEVVNQFELYGVPVDGGSAAVKLSVALADPASDVESADITPDGSLVVYGADAETAGQIELYSVPIGGGASRELSGLSAGESAGTIGSGVPLAEGRAFYPVFSGSVADVYSVPFAGRGCAVNTGTICEADGDCPAGDSCTPPDLMNDPLPPGGSLFGASSPEEGERFFLYSGEQETLGVVEGYAVPLDRGLPPVKVSGALIAGGNVVEVETDPEQRYVVYIADQDLDETFELYSSLLDADADGVPDALDDCPTVPGGDTDGDGFCAAEDCAPGDGLFWSPPGEATGLTLSHAGGPGGTTTLSWTAPAELGGAWVVYDTLRSSAAADFGDPPAVCLTSFTTETTTTDVGGDPAAGAAFFYLVRAAHRCDGTAGADFPAGTPRDVRACVRSDCGDGNLEAPLEACDDGGESATCDDDCTAAVCGDGVVNVTAGEACDDGNAIDDGNGCSAGCERVGSCSDGILQSLFELCDDGNQTNGDGCDDLEAGGDRCTPTACGNGVLTPGEQCDDGNSNDADGATDNCNADCTLPRYINNGDGTVTDTDSGLFWLRDAGCLGSGIFADGVNGALALADGACGLSDGSAAGQWSLPTDAQWQAAVAPAVTAGCTTSGAFDPPSITNAPGTGCHADGPQAFTGVQPDRYWSRTESGTFNAIDVNLATGATASSGKFADYRYWPVRASAAFSIDAASPLTGNTECRGTGSESACRAWEFENVGNLASPANGFAQPAVALNVIACCPDIHRPVFANDGFYGNGASWIGTSSGSWVKIDLGREVLVGSVRFGRDRTGGFDDRDPGNVTIQVATSDDVYANSNASNDGAEYVTVAGPTAITIVGSQTWKATFAPVPARYVKLIVSSSGAAIDEIEVEGP